MRHKVKVLDIIVFVRQSSSQYNNLGRRQSNQKRS